MKKHKAVFTQIHNEPLFFPMWLAYYSRYFDPSDIYVIHLLKPTRVPFDDWIEQQTGFVRIPYIDKDICDFQLVVNRAQEVQSKLLKKYECVLFAEADEFVSHYTGLGNYIDNWNGQVEVTNGYEVVHRFEEEPDIDLNAPILAQRNWWNWDKNYCKPLLVRVPITYIWGFHWCHQYPEKLPDDKDFLLIHLKKMDYKIGIERNLERQRNEADSELTKRKTGPGFQSWLSGFELEAWWKLSRPIEVSIPESIKKSVIIP